MRLVATWLKCRRIPGAQDGGYTTVFWHAHLVNQLRGKSNTAPIASVLHDFFDLSYLGEAVAGQHVRIQDPVTGKHCTDPCLSDGRKVWLAYELNRARSLVDKLKDSTSEDFLLKHELCVEDEPVVCDDKGHEAWLMLHPKHEGQVAFVKLPGAPPKWCDGRPYVGRELTLSAKNQHEGRRTMDERGDIEVRGGLLICQVSLHRASWDGISLQIPDVDIMKRDVIQQMLDGQAGLASVWCLLNDVMHVN